MPRTHSTCAVFRTLFLSLLSPSCSFLVNAYEAGINVTFLPPSRPLSPPTILIVLSPGLLQPLKSRASITLVVTQWGPVCLLSVSPASRSQWIDLPASCLSVVGFEGSLQLHWAPTYHVPGTPLAWYSWRENVGLQKLICPESQPYVTWLVFWLVIYLHKNTKKRAFQLPVKLESLNCKNNSIFKKPHPFHLNTYVSSLWTACTVRLFSSISSNIHCLAQSPS